jgi:hypothetical protein
MSAADYDAEFTGTLGLTAAELALLDNEVVHIRTSRQQQERLMESRISRHEQDFSDRAKRRAIKAEQSLFHQEMLDRFDTLEGSDHRVNNWVESNSTGKRTRTENSVKEGLCSQTE